MEYAKTKSRSTMKGEWFEVKVAALLFLRCKNSSHVTRFRIATNVEGAGALDDILLTFTVSGSPVWHTCFVQLKHREKFILTKDSFLGPRGDYSLRKYLKSCIEIKKVMSDKNENVLFGNCFENCRLVIYTNSIAHASLSKLEENKSDFLDSLFLSETESEMVLKINPNENDEFVHALLEDDVTIGEVRDFLEKFTLFTGEPSEYDMDDLIKRQLSFACGAVEHNPEQIYRIYEGLFKQWWRDSYLILDENSDILQRSLNQLTYENEQAKEVEIFSLKVNFEDSVWDIFNMNDLECVSIVHVLSIEAFLKISVTKVIRSLQNRQFLYTLLGLECLLRDCESHLDLWSKGNRDVLVVVSDHMYLANDLSELCLRLRQILVSNPNKKVIIVSVKRDPFESSFNNKTSIICKVIEDDFNIAQLHWESIDEIFGKAVLFQSHLTTLVDIFPEKLLLSLLMKDSMLETVLTSDILTLGGHIPEAIHYFIPRSLKRSVTLRTDVLKSTTLTDVFAVSGVSASKLQTFVPPELKVSVFGTTEVSECQGVCVACGCNLQLDEVDKTLGKCNSHQENGICFRCDSRYYTMDSDNAENNFKKLCKFRKYAHWLHMEGSSLEWKCSNASSTILKDFVDEGVYTVTAPETVCGLSDRLVLLAAEPGMGKSTLISHLAKSTKVMFPKHWVIQLKLRDHSDLLIKTPQLSATQFLFSAGGLMSALERELFRASLEETGNVIVFIDGFDEVCPKFEDEGCALVSSILLTKVKQLWVTCRQSMKDVLERVFLSVSYQLKEFTEEDQNNFFRTFWKRNEIIPQSPALLELLITDLRKMVQSAMSDHNAQFMGIPLQTMMIAEIFQGHVKDQMKIKVPKEINTMLLFQKFIDTKFDIFFKKTHTNLSKNKLKTIFIKNHMHAALILLFSNDQIKELHSSVDIEKKTLKFLRNISEGVDTSGIILGVINKVPNFIHRTFAEYFAGLWFEGNFHSNRSFFKKYLLGESYHVIRNIFDHLLSQGQQLHRAVLLKDALRVEALLSSGHVGVNSVDCGGRTALHLASVISSQNDSQCFVGPRPRHMVEILLGFGADVTIADLVCQWTPLSYAVHCKMWDVVEFLLPGSELLDRALPVEKLTNWNVFNIILQNGLVRLLNHLLVNGVPVDYMCKRNGNTLLHQACSFGHLPIVELLIARGANKRARNDDRETPLHVASRFGHVTLVMALVQSEVSTWRQRLFEFNWFRSYVNFQNVFHETPMYIAACSGHAEVVRLLLLCGVDIWKREKYGSTYLHVAAKNGRLCTVQVLLEHFGSDVKSLSSFVNAHDESLRTSALSMAAAKGHAHVVMYLASRGADVWTTCAHFRRTSLYWAARNDRLTAAKALLDTFHGDNVAVGRFMNLKDSFGHSALFIASQRGHFSIVSLLLSHGADIWERFANGKTCLHAASEHGRLHAAKALIESFGEDKENIVRYILSTDDEGRNAIECTDVTWSSIYYRAGRVALKAWLTKTLDENM